MTRESKEGRVFFGFMVVGFASLIGGIAMFFFIVLPQRQVPSGVPRDVQMIFTQVFSQQNMLKSETGRFSAAINQMGLDPGICQKYNCLLTLHPSFSDYQFRVSKDGSHWEIRSKSPVPMEVKP